VLKRCYCPCTDGRFHRTDHPHPRRIVEWCLACALSSIHPLTSLTSDVDHSSLPFTSSSSTLLLSAPLLLTTILYDLSSVKPLTLVLVSVE
jgi:hypothetical protein